MVASLSRKTLGGFDSRYKDMNTKRVTVTEREYDTAGNVVKETETVTEYDNGNSTVFPYGQPYRAPYTPPYTVTI